MDMKEEIVKIVERAVLALQKKEGFALSEIPEFRIERTKDERFGDYTTNLAMTISRELKKNPLELAKELAMEIEKDLPESVEKVEAAKPGYVNFYLSQKYFAGLLEKINREKDNFGIGGETGKIMVEYSQPNTHKEFHIGHLRNVFIGSSLVNSLRKGGQEVVAANYIGDTGTHIAKCLWGLLKFHKDEDLEKIENKGEFLGKVYSEANQKLEDNPEFEQEFRAIQKRMNEEESEIVEIWEITRRYSLDDFEKIYKKLGVIFDIYFFESEEEKEGKKILPELLEKGIAEESQGAIIANLEKYDLGILVLRRKDGSVLYGLKDIPLAVKKFKEYGIQKSIYIIDVRQSLYLKQIFKILELLGFKKDMVHIGYDFVSLKGGESMSSRKGNIVPAEELLRDVVDQVHTKFPDSPNPEGIGIGAIKFFMLKYSPETKIEFDMEKALSLDGNTGPYVQYAYARISGILEKAGKIGEGKVDLSLLSHDKELSLIRELSKFPELVEEISRNYEVHKLPYYAIGLADKFHSFYNDCRVIDKENPSQTAARLELVKAVKIVLGETLRLIGVEAPERM